MEFDRTEQRTSGDTMKKLRVGVIGLGMGRGHARRYKQDARVDLVAVADTDEARLQERADDLGVAGRYRDGAQLIARETPDVVCIATPNFLHKPLALQALEAGCHVLCEKPMALNGTEARAMMAASRKTGRRLMINFSFRFNPTSWAMKKEVESGAIGDIYYTRTVWLRRQGMPGFGSWFGQKTLSGGGPLIDLGVHRLDLALWLMGHPKPTWVMGCTCNHVASALAREEKKTYDVEDLAVAMIRFDNGAVVTLEASWAGHIKRHEMMETYVLGTRGGLRQHNPDPREPYRLESEAYMERNGFECDIALGKGRGLPTDAMTHFTDCILSDTPHMATAEEGLIVQDILDAIYESAGSGEPVRM